ncbi:MAG TPA: hypothetical protein ENJ56_07310 [Anaerolineae bacterium]|nr:hypothetical protein [Anaerolineae bacterium]
MIDAKNYDSLLNLLLEEVEVAQTGFESAADPQFETNKQIISLIAAIRTTLGSAEHPPTDVERLLSGRLRAAEKQLYHVEHPRNPLASEPKNLRRYPEPRSREQVEAARMARAQTRRAAMRQRRAQQRHNKLDTGLG